MLETRIKGSSPRMRGAHIFDYPVQMTDRIIPADAGSTHRLCTAMPSPMDHPRGCGEHITRSFAGAGGWGSSPRMRGAPCGLLFALAVGGIIPADAGSTTRHHPPDSLRQDHPRGCGEHGVMLAIAKPGGGSSPRMRGAHAIDWTQCDMTGIIPADAGSTRTSSSSRTAGKDHPRGCGEHCA